MGTVGAAWIRSDLTPPRRFGLALGADAKDIQLVMLLDVAVLADQLLLKSLQGLTVDFDERATAGANQVVMVLVPVLVLESVHSVAEVNLPANPCFCHELDRSRHGRIADILVLPADQIVQFLNGQMSLRGEKRIDDLHPLARMAQALLLHELFKPFSGIHDLRLHRRPRSTLHEIVPQAQVLLIITINSRQYTRARPACQQSLSEILHARRARRGEDPLVASEHLPLICAAATTASMVERPQAGIRDYLKTVNAVLR